ncbi:hypothetical protein [Spiroplasma endosymbiont of Stenodema calcarata]|uniref:hypothetical protein n=1 Tax=Spiroplasma endosymbiont of Stenodema calcarata TaxID=3139328 RepID=UPI003CCB4159
MKRIKEILKELKSKEYNILLDELEELFVELEKNQLFKEDFNVEQYVLPYHSGKIITKISLIDNLKYDNLPSKEDE